MNRETSVSRGNSTINCQRPKVPLPKTRLTAVCAKSDVDSDRPRQPSATTATSAPVHIQRRRMSAKPQAIRMARSVKGAENASQSASPSQANPNLPVVKPLNSASVQAKHHKDTEGGAKDGDGRGHHRCRSRQIPRHWSLPDVPLYIRLPEPIELYDSVEYYGLRQWLLTDPRLVACRLDAEGRCGIIHQQTQ